METKFTPGPWLHYADIPSTNENWHIVTNEAKKRVVANVHIEPNNQTDVANAQLIAAAPDLYAALEAFNITRSNIIGGSANDLVLRVPLAVIQQAADALARARGETP